MGQPTVGELKMRRTNIPRRFWWKHSFEDWSEGTVSRAKEWLAHYETGENGGVGLHIAGPAGTGKTALACHVGERLVMEYFSLSNTDYGVYFIRSDEYVEMQRNLPSLERFSNEDLESAERSQQHRHLIEDIQFHIPVLILDDLGKEYVTGTGFANDLLERTIRSRFDREKATIITTNFTVDEFTAHFSESMESFMKEALRSVQLTEKDRRAPE